MLSTLLSYRYQLLRNNLKHSRLHRIILTLSSVFFLCICTLVTLYIQNHQAQQQMLIESYSAGLTHITSDQLMVAMAEENKIGMQATLNKLIERDGVINAVIYDVDNRIMVQAGDVNGINIDDSQTRSFTSPITLDDSLLGSLTITMAVPEQRYSGLLLTVLMTLLILLGLFFLGSWIPEKNHTSIKHTTTTPMTKGGSKEGTEAEGKQVEQQQALLKLHLHTVDKLHQQLSADMRLLEFKKLDTFTQKILTLYSGKLIAASPNTLLFSFRGSDKNTALFNALCSAHLMGLAAEKSQSLLRFTRFIYDASQSIPSSEVIELKSLKTQEHEGTVINKNTLDDELKSRLSLTLSSHPDYWYVSGLSHNYSLLLDKQLTHLL